MSREVLLSVLTLAKVRHRHHVVLRGAPVRRPQRPRQRARRELPVVPHEREVPPAPRQQPGPARLAPAQHTEAVRERVRQAGPRVLLPEVPHMEHLHAARGPGPLPFLVPDRHLVPVRRGRQQERLPTQRNGEAPGSLGVEGRRALPEAPVIVVGMMG